MTFGKSHFSILCACAARRTMRSRDTSCLRAGPLVNHPRQRKYPLDSSQGAVHQIAKTVRSFIDIVIENRLFFLG